MIMKARGSSAQHLFGPLYNISEDYSILGLRVYSDATEVWNIEFYVEKSYSSFNGSSLPSRGSTFRDILVVENKIIKLGSSRYKQRELSEYDEILINKAFLKDMN